MVDRTIRYLTSAGELVPTPEEAEQVALRQSMQATQRAERLAAKLRELGIDPESV